MGLSMTSAAIDHALSEAYDPELGARPLRRYLEKHVVSALSKCIISGELASGQQALVDECEGHLKINVTGARNCNQDDEPFLRTDSAGSYTRRSESNHTEASVKADQALTTYSLVVAAAVAVLHCSLFAQKWHRCRACTENGINLLRLYVRLNKNQRNE